MRLQASFRGTLIALKEMKGQKDPNKTYYRMSVENDDEAGVISCSESVYGMFKAGSIKKYVEYDFICTVNTDFGSVTCNAVYPVTGKSGETK